MEAKTRSHLITVPVGRATKAISKYEQCLVSSHTVGNWLNIDSSIENIKTDKKDTTELSECHTNPDLWVTITKWQIAYIPLNQVANYVHMLHLNNRLRVGWKTLPNLKFSNLNFKLKVQTQTWTSKTKNIPCPPG